MDEWVLFELDSPVTANARGVGRGLLYTREGALVGSCIQEALLRPQAEAKGLCFEVDVDRLLPAWIETDAVRLRQVLINLVRNAIKFTDSGFVRLVVSPHGERACFEVSDSGMFDLAVDGTTTNNTFEDNECDTSSPGGLCGDDDD